LHRSQAAHEKRGLLPFVLTCPPPHPAKASTDAQSPGIGLDNARSLRTVHCCSPAQARFPRHQERTSAPGPAHLHADAARIHVRQTRFTEVCKFASLDGLPPGDIWAGKTAATNTVGSIRLTMAGTVRCSSNATMRMAFLPSLLRQQSTVLQPTMQILRNLLTRRTSSGNPLSSTPDYLAAGKRDRGTAHRLSALATTLICAASPTSIADCSCSIGTTPEPMVTISVNRRAFYLTPPTEQLWFFAALDAIMS
jgi:hypothetical protein